MKILLIVGPASNRQGWGNADTTRAIQKALVASGHSVHVLDARSLEDLLRELERESYDMAWSSIYCLSPHSHSYNGALTNQVWVADVLDSQSVPYVGSSAKVLQLVHSKLETNRILAANGVPVPRQMVVYPGKTPSEVVFPVIVKPCYESESIGISEDSVVETPKALIDRVVHVHQHFSQAALVEEYLPGRELTSAMIGNGANQLLRPIVNRIHQSAYQNYPVLSNKVKLEQQVEFFIPANSGPLCALTRRVGEVLECRDHARIDLREDAHGVVKVIEVNANPGLDPRKSRSAQVHAMYSQVTGEDGSYASLVNCILDAAHIRCGHVVMATNR